MKNFTSWIKNSLLVIIVTFLSFESLSFVATKLEMFLINEIPSVYNFNSNTNYPDIAFGRTEREKWGAWHVANSTFRHSKRCFDVAMTFNEVGARDDSFVNLPNVSLFLLGDSFAEGYGVAKEETSEQLIEEGLGLPILNFGASGNFGPLQQLIIYEEFKQLPHQGLLIYVLPSNDFTDNDLESWLDRDRKRYRPYFSQSDNPLTPYYFPTSIPRDNFLFTSLGPIKQIIKEYLWSANALRTVSMLIRGDVKFFNDKENNYPILSYYYDASKKQQSNFILAYEALLQSADNKNVLFVIIPSLSDIERWESETYRDGYKQSYWYRSLINFQDRTKQRVEILNLIEYLPAQIRELFFECDRHWSPRGNAWAAELVMSHIRNSNLFEAIK